MANYVTNWGTSKPKFRSKVFDVAGRTLYDEYEITFDYVCWHDSVSMNNLIDQTYNFGTGTMTLQTPVVTHTANCPLVYTIFGFFTGYGEQDLWKQYDACSNCLAFIITGFNSATGVATINNASGTRLTTGDLML